MQERTTHERIVRSKCLAGALVWLGFDYEKTEEGYFKFRRTNYFDRAWQDLHAQRDFLNRLRNK